MSKAKKNTSTAVATTKKAEIAHFTTVNEALDKFFSNAGNKVSNAVTQDVRAAVDAIRAEQVKMVEAAQAIGERLIAIRTKLGTDLWGTFVDTIVPRMGISRSSAFRWIGSAELVKAQLPNPTVRRALYLLTDGRNLTTTDDKGKVVLTPAFQKAIKAVGAAPTGTLDDDKAEQYALRLKQELGKAGRNAVTNGEKQKKAAEIIKARFAAFLKSYGTDAAEKLLTALDNHLTQESKTIMAEASKPQPKPNQVIA